MSVESSKARRNQQNELSDLQSEFAQKKKKYASEQEQQLADMKDYYNERKEDTRVQGEAAINHIRRKQSENVETSEETRHKVAERGQAQIDGLETDYRKKVAETRTRRQIQLDEARENSKNKINEITENQQHKVDQVRARSNEELQTVKDKYNKELHSTQEFTDKRLTQIKDSNEMSVKHEMEKGRQVQEKLGNNLRKEYDFVDQTGKQRISERRDVQETQYNRQESDYDKRFHKQQEHWDAREKGQTEQYANRIAHSKKAYENQLKDQHDRFDSIYQKNNDANRESLNIQNRNLLKEQVELKKKFFKENEKFAGKEDDPFYKLQDRGNRLRENSDFYIIEAYVPHHEKDNVKVTIKDGTAAISGKRAFKDELEEDGRKLSTSSYQTFREEFSFDKPVITEGMTRERSGDYVTFWVPKLNSFDGARKLSKKV